MNEKRGSFKSSIGFVLAAAGSAVGLGNLWRFPYLAAMYGGGTFLIIYLVMAVTFGFSLMVGEISIGRKTGLSCIKAFDKLNSRFKWLGILNASVPILIVPYYSVIGGWVTKYMMVYLFGHDKEAAKDGFFNSFISGSLQPAVYFIIFFLISTIVILMGVQNGVEKVSKILMPILVILTFVVAIYSMTIKGAAGGIKYYLVPQAKYFTPKTLLAAVGQLFYSLSLAMGIMVTYGSYMKKDTNIEKSARQIEVFDTLIAFLAGMMIIPAVYAFSGIEGMTSGPGLMFIALPKVFNSMVIGRCIGFLFFLLVFFAALTSAISLEETVVSVYCDQFNINRKRSVVITVITSMVLGILSALGYGPLGAVKLLGMQFLDFFDFISNSVIMPVVSIGICIFIGFVIKPSSVKEEVECNGEKFHAYGLFYVMTKWIAPVLLTAILVTSILSAFGIFSF